MTIDADLLDMLIHHGRHDKLDYTLHIKEKSYDMSNVFIANSPTPVTRPTTRGGVYFSKKFEYRVKGTVRDISIVPLLSSAMLGPNTEFGDVQIHAIMHNDKMTRLCIHTNLISSVQEGSGIELHMTITGLESD